MFGISKPNTLNHGVDVVGDVDVVVDVVVRFVFENGLFGLWTLPK